MRKSRNKKIIQASQKWIFKEIKIFSSACRESQLSLTVYLLVGRMDTWAELKVKFGPSAHPQLKYCVRPYYWSCLCSSISMNWIIAPLCDFYETSLLCDRLLYLPYLTTSFCSSNKTYTILHSIYEEGIAL